MADIRFKISGSSSPFVAQIFAAGGTTPLQQLCIDYAGSVCNSCNIFGNLQPATPYTLKIYDSIGCSTTCSMTTATAVGTTTLAPKTISIGGTPAKVGTACISTGLISITPALSIGECMTMNFSGLTYGGTILHSNSTLSISCKGAGTTTYVPVVNDTNYGNRTSNILLKYGDLLCYSIGTTGTVSGTGCAQICLVGVTSSQITPVYGSRSKQVKLSTTTTTTTVAPPSTTSAPPSVEIAIACVKNSSTAANSIRLNGKIVTSRPLAAGESVTLCVFTNTDSDTTNDPINTITANAYVKTTSTATASICACSQIHAGFSNTVCGGNNNGKITINSTSINNVCLYVDALSNASNADSMYGNSASLRLYSIASQTGTNFSINPQFNELCATNGYTDAGGDAVTCTCKGFGGTTYPAV